MTDTTAPKLLSLTPPDNALDVEAGTEFVLKFDEPVKAGTGLIYGYVALTGNGFLIPASDVSQVTINGDTVTFKPTTGPLEYQDYSIRIYPGAFQDLSGNPYAGLMNLTDWNISVAKPSYALTCNVSGIDEGGTATFVLTTTHVPAGTSLTVVVGNPGLFSDHDAYAGANELDVSGGTFHRVTVGADGKATFDISFLQDHRTEGDEQFHVSVSGDWLSQSACSLSLHDTSILTVKEPVIDLGPWGQLIHPVQVDGTHYYYYWDVSGDGTSNPEGAAGPLNHGADEISIADLLGVFAFDAQNSVPAGVDRITSPDLRYAWIQGVHMALPTVGAYAPNLTSGGWLKVPGTSIGATVPAQGDPAVNPTYDDLLAIWDAYNGAGTGQSGDLPSEWLSGYPDGWRGTYLTREYVVGSAYSPGGWKKVNFTDGSIGLSKNGVGNVLNTDDQGRVIVEVLFPDAEAPQIVSFDPARNAKDVPNDANLVIHFSEPIKTGEGSVTLKAVDGKTIAVYDRTSPNMTINGNTLTIDPSSDLSPGTQYQLEFSLGAVADLANNACVDLPNYPFKTHTVYVPGTVPSAKFWNAPNKMTSGDGMRTAIALSDILESLKLYLGKSVANPSPYKYIAADFDGNGKVNLTDVLGALKYYLGKSTGVMPQWVFVDRTDIEQRGPHINAGQCDVTAIPYADVENSSAEVVGVLRGDVDGGWVGT